MRRTDRSEKSRARSGRLALVAGLFLLAFTAGAADKPPFVIHSMKLDFLNTPNLQYTNYNTSQLAGKNNRWVALETYFIPDSAQVASGWYDNVTMEGTAILKATDSAMKGVTSNTKDQNYVVLSGQTRFITIEGDNSRHLGLLLVPPKLANRFVQKGVLSERNFLAARIQFFAPGRVLLGEGYWEPRGGLAKPKDLARLRKMFEEIEKDYNNIIRLEGGLYSKEKTPFQWYNYDYYDLIADDAAPKATDRGKAVAE